MWLTIFCILLCIPCFLADWVYYYGVGQLNASDFMILDRMWVLSGRVGKTLHPNLISLQNVYSGVSVDIFTQKDLITVVFDVKDSFPSKDSCNVSFAKGMVGFSYDKYYRSIRHSVYETLKSVAKATHHKKPIVACGKGMGGVIAQLFAADFHVEFNVKAKVWKGVIMYDSPKVGSLLFSEECCRHMQCVRVSKEKSSVIMEFPKDKVSYSQMGETFAISSYEIRIGAAHLMVQ